MSQSEPSPDNVVTFNRKKLEKKRRKAISKATTLCGSGHHKWQVVTENRFDVKQGKLVTVYECSRCHKRKTKAH